MLEVLKSKLDLVVLVMYALLGLEITAVLLWFQWDNLGWIGRVGLFFSLLSLTAGGQSLKTAHKG